MTEGVCADVPNAESGSSSGPSSPPSEQQLSSLVLAMRSQTLALEHLAQAILAMSVAAERSASASLMLVDMLAQQPDEDEDVPRDLLGRKVV